MSMEEIPGFGREDPDEREIHEGEPEVREPQGDRLRTERVSGQQKLSPRPGDPPNLRRVGPAHGEPLGHPDQREGKHPDEID
ncbi:hypothetical protein GVX82_03365 [Patescibacteria group bacterium]|jgi:hypothetical protein|nr:hypothetical protein [Patescibacteria group bacterium]